MFQHQNVSCKRTKRLEDSNHSPYTCMEKAVCNTLVDVIVDLLYPSSHKARKGIKWVMYALPLSLE